MYSGLFLIFPTQSVFQNNLYLLSCFCYRKWSFLIFAFLFTYMTAIDVYVLILYNSSKRMLLNSLTVHSILGFSDTYSYPL